MKHEVECQICGKHYKCIQPLSKHVSSKHNIGKKEYYDLYMKTSDEGSCKTCGDPTHFHSMDKGYNLYCSKHCQVSAEAKMINSKKYVQYEKLRRQYESENNCIQKAKLYKLYGQRALDALKLPQISKYECHFIDNSYIPVIEKYLIDKLAQRKANNGRSILENTIADSIKVPTIRNTKSIISPLELDIYIPSLNIAVEFNGSYWHSIEAGTSIDYHLNKSLLCRARDIRLIHIYEFEDIDRQIYLLNELINGNDLYPKDDFNKNNLIDTVPEPEIIFKSNRRTVYGAGPLKEA